MQRSGAEGVLDGADLFGESCGPGLFAGRGGDRRGLDETDELRGRGDGGGSLVFGAEPADESSCFFGATLGIQRRQPAEDLFVSEVVGPVVGVEDGWESASGVLPRSA